MSTMLPVFANPAGLWALLGVPTVLAVHFLQQRSRLVTTSTWFLIENVAPDSRRGRTWERLRSSRQLWLQLLAVLLASWLLAEPRWVRAESAQTVVLVMDSSASMAAFRSAALTAAEGELAAADGLAARTTWIVLPTDPHQPPLYRGPDRAAASTALQRWQPELGEHDLVPALRQANSLAGAAGRTLLITDRKSKVPPGQRAAGVGRVLDNVGFAGASTTREDSGVTWRALVQNHSATAQRRAWHLELADGSASAAQAIELAPGALVEISGQFAPGVDALTVVLATDGFALDDRLPLVRPAPKPLRVAVEGNDAAAEFFRKVAGEVDGASLVSLAGGATLRLARLAAAEVATERHGGIFWPPAVKRTDAKLSAEPVVAERDPLVVGLNWQGWLGPGPTGYETTTGDTTLLWQGRRALALVRHRPDGGRKLLLAFDWDSANGARLPAMVLMTRRFLETERDAQRAPVATNFDGGSALALPGLPADGDLTLVFQPGAGGAAETSTVVPAERAALRAPGRAGFFTLRRGEELLVRGAAQFADPRQGDFKNAETFRVELPGERAAALERTTAPDPWVTVWLLALGACGLGSWWEKQRGGAAA